MKNSIVLKLLALLLCAASLAGIVGGTAGALVLVERDLYNKTVDEVIDQRVQNLAAESANQIAFHYADRILGGCPEEISRSDSNHLARNFSFYGYAILDGEGNVLESLNLELKDRTQTHTIPITGQYMHLVSIETESEKLARETAARMESISRGMEDQNGQTVPPGGIPVNQVIFTDSQGAPVYEAYGDSHTSQSIFHYSDSGNVRSNSTYDHEPQNQIGFLYYGAGGQLMYRSFLEELDHNFSTAEICGVMFLSHESEFLFQTENPDGLGILTFENGHLCFAGYPAEESPAETQPEETVTETVPEPTAEESTPETAAAEEISETAQSEDTKEKTSKKEVSKETEVSDKEEAAEEKKSSSASAVPEKSTDSKEDQSGKKSTKPAESKETTTPATVSPETVPEESLPAETVPSETSPMLINGKPLESYQVNRVEYVSSTGEQTTAKYVYLPMPELTVEIYADRDVLGNTALYNVLRVVRQYRSYLLPVIGVCLLLFVLTALYLCTAAGRKPGTEEVKAGGVNRLSLDLYLFLGTIIGTGVMALAGAGTPILLRSDFLMGCSLTAAAVFICCLIFTGFCFAFVAQIKTSGGFWWRNLLCIRFVFLAMALLQRLEVWLREKCFPCLGWLLKHTWARTWKFLTWLYRCIEKVTARTGAVLNRFFSLIPMTWQWLLGGLTIILFALLVNTHHILLILMGILIPMAIVLYATHCFGILSESAKQMGKGNLDTKVENKLMTGCFRDFANDLNDLADVAMVAAQKQLKSERMKTELITNVSHDIKTPLTSIINYVDLLQKPHTEEEEAQYLDVLDRQSHRLKKLVEDLMDMSKASTGNMTVEITQVDAVESINQALGEFSDKLEQARLYPVFRHTADTVPMMADGKLVWRVLSNLLSNAVKYGMPGTRIYLDLLHVNGKVIISLKNISREELNVTAEELMERFVRGDVSRNTEGSGLGLNIAKSLMELQKGHLQLLVDGDLFKVTLIFPDAK